ncbi:type II CRISPR RNA-guided endonuclease Cas9 [Candidatus Phycosocius spiralis]|uniref:CRISPR-associated endonuclease Cas9 n=1 Tax=Candidatus Phycosocius spiralis TaxID=2815099 RepID=A0ABQ4PW25_9PROT|nr:type II CRISPR RNA-guided endonuclease Cas9 [Candidatus Phycosocius spiralis]GIU67208.1 hypothetical protein PsB1_1362 [Candidatus Phycosocius spiralis]
MTGFVRFSFDMGTNSLGWAVFLGQYPNGVKSARITGVAGVSGELTDISSAGVRIYSDGRNPKDGKSLAEMRRGPRAARRRRDRFLQRQRGLNRLLKIYGLFPTSVSEGKALARLDPLKLRAEALERALTPYELGRAIWHLNQRRGFKSNRKTDKADESGKVKSGQARLNAALEQEGFHTLGQWLYNRRAQGSRFRATPDPESKAVGKTWFEFYPERGMVEDEFDIIWSRQANYHPSLMTDVARDTIRKMVFFQRPLKKQQIGKCTFNSDELRAPKALPSVEAREIYERLNQLRFGFGPVRTTTLDRHQRDALAATLLAGDKVSWDKVRRTLKLPADTLFNLEDTLKELPSSKTAARMKKPDAFGAKWLNFSLADRDEIMWRFIDTEDEAELAAWLVETHRFEHEVASKLAASPTAGQDGYGRLGVTANRKILEQLLADHLAVYSIAAERAGYHHSDFRTGEVMDRLPYYGEVLERHIIDSGPELREAVAAYKRDKEKNANRADGKVHSRKFLGAGLEEAETGRVPNPTVHIGLNQLRRVVNRLIETYGPPDEIVLELARELKMNDEQKKKADEENRKNRKANERRRLAIEALKLPVNGKTLMRHRLFDLQMVGGIVLCPYSLRAIGLEQALGGGEIDVDHILPFSRSYDDGVANKILCYRSANQQKRNRSPAEAFEGNAEWPSILANAQTLGRSRAWRFAPDAMDRFKDMGGFLERQLNETKHLARIARAYLECLTPNVWVVTGQLTALMRGKWGLNGLLNDDNRKNRNDHRHHAIDAITIGCISRSLLNRLSTATARAEENNLERLFDDFPEPMADFRAKAKKAVEAIIVSHKPEHGKGGALHEETAYGLNVHEHEKALGNVVLRLRLDDLTVKEAERVRDPALRKVFLALRHDVQSDQKAFTRAVQDWALKQANDYAAAFPNRPHRQPMQRVRILKPEAALVPIYDANQSSFTKGLVPAENYCVDIVKMRDGTWKGFGATIFEVNRKDWRPIWEREKLGGLLMMRLHKGDLVELEDSDGVRRVKRVVRIAPSGGRMYLATHFEAGSLQERHDAPDSADGFRWDLASFSKLRDRGARKVKINEVGSPR